MKKTRLLFPAVLAVLTAPFLAAAQGTAFTYQGRLDDAGTPATGLFDLRFALFDAGSGGNAVGGARTNAAVPVTNGLFTVTLDFGYDAFDGSSRYLEIGVQPAGGTNFNLLAPRQAVTAAPYAQFAGRALSASTANTANFVSMAMNASYATAAGSVSATGIFGTIADARLSANVALLDKAAQEFSGTNTFDGAVIATNALNRISGTFAGDGSGLYLLNASQLASGTMPDARLSANVALLNVTNTFTSAVIATNAGNVIAGSFTGSGAGLTQLNGGGLAAGSVSNAALSDASVTADKVADAQVVKSLNGLKDGVTLSAGQNISLATNGNSLEISAATWSLTGNSGTSPTNGNFIGTTDNQPLELRVNNQRALRLEPATGFDGLYYYYGAVNQAGGSPANFIAPDAYGYAYGSVIVGGGYSSAQYGSSYYPGETNSVASHFCLLGGGVGNSIQQNANYSFLGGGSGNSISDGGVSFLGGGARNSINAGSSFLGGGQGNSIQPNAGGSFLGGGIANSIQPNATYSFLGGGYGNSVSGPYAVVPGGSGNSAGGVASFAAGHRAKANYNGDFVWADTQETDFNATAANQFLIRAAGGVGIGIANPAAQLHVSSPGGEYTPQVCIDHPVANGTSVLRFTLGESYDRRWDMAVQTNRFALYSGQFGYDMLVVNESGLTVHGTVNQSSDRSLKENFQAVDAQEVLNKVAALPITRWNYKADQAQQHVGPMAQDFYAAFAVGADDRHITTVDESGVALAAIQGLNQKLEAAQAENAGLKARVEKLEQLINTLTAK